MKRKRNSENPQDQEGQEHFFKDDNEVKALQKHLLDWYSESQRTLPWRTLARDEADDDIRGYAVWVSEIMLQQTQVATVIDYYNRWMAKWPSMQALSKATLDEVNQAWAGLGYYSRGKRLWEGAKKIVDEYDGKLPQTAQELEKSLPGVGRYTAAAIASIAFKEPVGLVDGNVIRVISRMRKIGAESTSNEAIGAFWTNANAIVCSKQPGDFNQALMELGATVCTPKGPNCSECPVRKFCRGQNAKDIEDLFCNQQDCKLCLPRDLKHPDVIPEAENKVLNFPRKEKKTKVRDKTDMVCIFKNDKGQVCLMQRPKTGLLANLYEFPSVEKYFEEGHQDLWEDQVKLEQYFKISLKKLKSHGDVDHKFSHINQTYQVYSASVASTKICKPTNYQNVDWIDESELLTTTLPISTAMKKVIDFYYHGKSDKAEKRPKKRKVMTEIELKQQPSILKFFGKK